jgi:hypothetical protein
MPRVSLEGESFIHLTFLLTTNHSNRFDRAFVDFYEDELVHLGYDWKQVVDEYLFTDQEPVFDSIMAARMLHATSASIKT